MLSKFADVTKLEGVDGTLQGCAALQMDLNWLEKWSDKDLMKFNKRKCKVVPWEQIISCTYIDWD